MGGALAQVGEFGFDLIEAFSLHDCARDYAEKPRIIAHAITSPRPIAPMPATAWRAICLPPMTRVSSDLKARLASEASVTTLTTTATGSLSMSYRRKLDSVMASTLVCFVF